MARVSQEGPEGLLPAAILNRKKSPYPKTHNPISRFSQDRLLGILSDSSSPLRQLVDVEHIRGVIAEGGKAFDQPWFGQLMTDAQLFAYLIQVDIWMREYRVSLC